MAPTRATRCSKAFHLGLCRFVAAGLIFVLTTAGCRRHASPPPPAAWPTAGWERAEPEFVGWASARLAATLRRVQDDGLDVDGLFLVRYGRAYLDARFHPYDGRRHDVASVTKSITATLIGIALQRNDLSRLDARVYELLDRAAGDPRKRELTVEHLLTMQSGFDCGVRPGEVEVTGMMASDDWVSFALDLAMRDPPGTTFRYCSPNTHLLSAIVTKLTGMSALDYARAHLFGPLGITDVVWPADPQGISHGWGNLQLRPEDMAKIGYLYLQSGQWEGRRILPEDWVGGAWTAHAQPTTDPGTAYGYGWWILEGDFSGVFEARGRGGQAITVWPKIQFVAAWTGRGREARGQLAQPLVQAMRSPGPISRDDKGAAELASALAAAAQAPQPREVAPLPDVAVQVSGIRFVVEANPLGLEEVQLDFQPGANEAVVRLLIDTSLSVLQVGLDGVQRFSPGPRGIEVGARGHWTPDDRFELEFHERAGPEHLTMTFALIAPQEGRLIVRDPAGYRPELSLRLQASL